MLSFEVKRWRGGQRGKEVYERRICQTEYYLRVLRSKGEDEAKQMRKIELNSFPRKIFAF